MSSLPSQKLPNLRSEADLANLKIMIVSMPKTGNTWLKSLLAMAYDLPSVELPSLIDSDALDRLGNRWIGHEHYYPEAHLLQLAKERKIILLTPIRHPGDVLVSYLHYLRNFVDDRPMIPSLMKIARDEHLYGSEAMLFVQTGFRSMLNMSISWIASRQSLIVRYEDLWHDTLGKLTELTNQIHPLPQERVVRAVYRSDLRLMRSINRSESRFFRRGKVGEWAKELPESFTELFRTLSPYPAQFAALNYSLDLQDRSGAAAPTALPLIYNPLQDVQKFDNGVETAPIFEHLYLSFDADTAKARWPDIADTQSPTSFYRWLNQPAEADPRSEAGEPLISNLAAYIWWTRPDLFAAYPDIYGADRLGYIRWFLSSAVKAHQIDTAFIEPIRQSLVAWASASDPQDVAAQNGEPVLTRFAAYLYALRTDIHASLPRIYGRDRIRYVVWFIKYAALDHGFEPLLTQPMRKRFGEWAVLPDQADPHRSSALPCITHLAAYMYRQNSAVSAMYPDLYGRDRVAYLLWFVNTAYVELDIDIEWLFPIIDSLLKWGNAIDERDQSGATSGLQLTRMLVYLYRRDPALQARFSDIYGKQRIAFLLHCLGSPVRIDSWNRGDFESVILQQWAELAHRVRSDSDLA